MNKTTTGIFFLILFIVGAISLLIIWYRLNTKLGNKNLFGWYDVVGNSATGTGAYIYNWPSNTSSIYNY